MGHEAGQAHLSIASCYRLPQRGSRGSWQDLRVPSELKCIVIFLNIHNML